MSKCEELADEIERVSVELEKAAAHCRITGEHFKAQNVPRACAQMFTHPNTHIIARQILCLTLKIAFVRYIASPILGRHVSGKFK